MGGVRCGTRTRTLEEQRAAALQKTAAAAAAAAAAALCSADRKHRWGTRTFLGRRQRGHLWDSEEGVRVSEVCFKVG